MNDQQLLTKLEQQGMMERGEMLPDETLTQFAIRRGWAGEEEFAGGETLFQVLTARGLLT
jgi:hypothetical protein